MRISDWSSDVCSSDLARADDDPSADRGYVARRARSTRRRGARSAQRQAVTPPARAARLFARAAAFRCPPTPPPPRGGRREEVRRPCPGRRHYIDLVLKRELGSANKIA